MLPRNFAISTSLEGISAICLIVSVPYTVPSTIPAFNSIALWFLPNSFNNLAGAVASS